MHTYLYSNHSLDLLYVMATQFPVSEDVPFMGFIIIQYYDFCALLNLGNQVLKVLVSLTLSAIPTRTYLAECLLWTVSMCE